MRLDDYRESSNVEQDNGRGSGFGGFGGGGGMGLIFSLVASRFGIVGIIVLGLGMFLLGINPFGGGGQRMVGQSPQATSETAAQVCAAGAGNWSLPITSGLFTISVKANTLMSVPIKMPANCAMNCLRGCAPSR